MHRWKFSALATAAILSTGLFSTDASALALGRVNVQSSLGEPLRAEIELPQITPAEAESLRVTPANAAVFRSQGLEYSPAVGNVQVQVHRRADGTMVLRLSSSRPINEPFVDLVLDATWSSGHIVRSYTMLFDPPAQASKPAEVAVAPQVAAPRAESAPATPRAPAVRAPAPQAAPAAAAPAAQATPRPAPRVAPTPSRPPNAETGANGKDAVTVRPGDTAGRIAGAHRPASVSLDQMLVAMAQANPNAFVNGNVNRLRSGAVLQLPSEADAKATPAAEARQIVAAQSRDFNEFRRRLAGAAPTAKVAAAERSASGSVQTQVDDSKPAASSPDKLTLSKGGVQARKADEQLAHDKQSDQNTARLAELSKNISELNQLSGGTPKTDAAAAAGAAAPAASAPGLAVPAPAGVSETKPQPPATAAAEAPTPQEPAPPAAAPEAAPQAAAAAPAPAPAAPAPAAQPASPEEPSFLATLTEDPVRAGGALALILALLGYGGYRVAQSRRQQAARDSSFPDSGNPDSFFGASGGQRVDTADSSLSTGASSMSYSPSQLDVGGDVDPVAEADVYLAYGRDLQAEEILKEALRHSPERVAIPAKLADIYAKRQDRKALESAANDVFRLTDGKGADWSHVADLGRALDPDNALYQPGGRPAAPDGSEAETAPSTIFPSTVSIGAPASTAPAPDSVLPDLDLDLDLDLHDAPPAAAPAPSAFAMAAAAASEQAAAPMAATPPAANEALLPALDSIDLELPPLEPAAEHKPGAPSTEVSPLETEPVPLDFDADKLLLSDTTPSPLGSDAKDSGPAPLEFDLGDLSLDLSAPASTGTAAPAHTSTSEETPDDPLTTKLALAEEFNTIGDSEGARILVEEVIAESTGELKTRAQRLLAELG